MDFPRLITWTCPAPGCRKTYFTVLKDGYAVLLCNLCGYTAQVQFSPAPPAEPVPTDPNHPDFQPL